VKEMAELTLKQRILNEIELKKHLSDEVVKLSGYADLSGFKKPLKNETKEFENKFYGLVDVVRFLFPEDEKKLIAEYALTVDPKKSTARHLLEYSEINGLTGMKEDLISRMIECGNGSSEEMAEIYQIEWLHSQEKIGINEAVKRFSNINSKQPEIKAAIEIYKSYCHLVEQQFDMIYHCLIAVDEYIKEIKEPYIKNMFHGRYSLLMIEHYSRKDDLTKAREFCYELLNNNTLDLYKGWAYLHLGNTYIVESFDKGYEYLAEGIEIATKRFRGLENNLKRSMNFLCNVWNKDPKYLDLNSKSSSDIHEIAFYYLNKGQITEAEKTLNKVNLDEISFNSRGFHYYLRGRLTNNMDYYAESVINFKQSGDMYFRKLPLLELRKLNIPDSIIKALTM
jgi:tetratricopeptide (TPR) repeat protein